MTNIISIPVYRIKQLHYQLSKGLLLHRNRGYFAIRDEELLRDMIALLENYLDLLESGSLSVKDNSTETGNEISQKNQDTKITRRRSRK